MISPKLYHQKRENIDYLDITNILFPKYSSMRDIDVFIKHIINLKLLYQSLSCHLREVNLRRGGSQSFFPTTRDKLNRHRKYLSIYLTIIRNFNIHKKITMLTKFVLTMTYI